MILVNTNLQGLNSHRHLRKAQIGQHISSMRLSSGLRINSAKDDAAGLAISEKKRAIIRGHEQASRNGQDAVSLLTVMDGGMAEINEMILRKRALTIQALNDINTLEDKQFIQLEIDQLLAEIYDTANRTQFNTLNLLNVGGESSQGVDILGAYTMNPALNPFNPFTPLDALNLWFMRADGSIDRIEAPPFSHMTGTAQTNFGEMYMAPVHVFLDEGPFIDVNGNTYFRARTGFGFRFPPESPHFIPPPLQRQFDIQLDKTITIRQDPNGTGQVYEITHTIRDSGITGNLSLLQVTHLSLNYWGHTWEISNTPPGGGAAGLAPLWGTSFSFTVTPTEMLAEASHSLHIQIGPSSGHSKFLSLFDLRPITTGLADLNITTHAQANDALQRLDTALDQVNSYRAIVGAQMNRLAHAIRSNDIAFENLSASESRIRDADMAKEMMAFTKSRVLQEAAATMLAHARQAPEMVLQLIS